MTGTSVRGNHNEAEYPMSVYWFRHGLRLHDNPPFRDACAKSKHVLPIFVIDPNYPFAETANRKPGAVRSSFVVESLLDLNDRLVELGSQLTILRGRPENVIPDVCNELQAAHLFYERESAAPIRDENRMVIDAVQAKSNEQQKQGSRNQSSKKIEFKGYDTHTLFEMEHYVSKCSHGTAPNSYGQFIKLFTNKMGNVAKECDPVESIPPLPKNYESFLSNMDKYDGANVDHYSNPFPIPSMKELGYKEVPSHPERFKGGETEGLRLLDRMMTRKSWVAQFEKPKTLPNTMKPDTTGLSAYVKHGCVSPRLFYYKIAAIYQENKDHSKPPTSLHGQLLWREYNMLMAYTTPNFEKMRGNPVARQIPWDDNPELLAKWKDSQTGYPFIDAIMMQLKETGWIHHLARHATACFLTRGDLWQSWEKGAEVFEERLIDAEWTLNNFNWQWLSCTAHFYQYFRCYSPVTFGKKSDKNGDYIRKWLPQFKKFPAQFIYEPWKAPIEVQHDAGVVIGKDYPEPVVDHKIASKMNMAKMKIAYDANKTAAANDEEVDLDGLYDEQRQGEHEEHQSRGENKKKRKR